LKGNKRLKVLLNEGWVRERLSAIVYLSEEHGFLLAEAPQSNRLEHNKVDYHYQFVHNRVGIYLLSESED
jgi:hypothetical protein